MFGRSTDTRARRSRRLRFQHPAQVVVFAFGTAVAIGTLLLMLSRHGEADLSGGW